MAQSIFDIAGSAMRAQNLRLNTTASNLANANSVASSADEAYKARHPVFAAMLDQEIGGFRNNLTEVNQTITRLRDQLRKMDIETAEDGKVISL